MKHCPDCNSTQVIPWDDGYLCCSCGCEFGSLPREDESEEEDK